MEKGNNLKINLLDLSVFIGVDKNYDKDISFDINVNDGICKVLNISEVDLQRRIESFKYLADMFCNQLKEDISLKISGNDPLKKAMKILLEDFEIKDQERKKQSEAIEAKFAIEYYTKVLKKYQ